MDIKQIINKEIEKIDLEEIVRNEVKSSLKKMLQDKVKNLFNSWGDISKQLEEFFKQKFILDLSNVDLVDHASFVANCISEQLAEAFQIERESIKRLINSKIFTETRSEIPLKVFEAEVTELILDDFGVDKERYDEGYEDISIDFEFENDGYSSDNFKRLNIKIDYDSKEKDAYIGLHNGKIYHHRTSIDPLDNYIKLLRFRGTKIIK